MFLDPRFDFYRRSPQEILSELNHRVKSDRHSEELRFARMKEPREEDIARIHFLRSNGVISRLAPAYHNKTWEFSSPNGPEQYGCVLLIHPGPNGIVLEQLYAEKILAGGFELTKETLVDELSEDYDRILFLDIGCNSHIFENFLKTPLKDYDYSRSTQSPHLTIASTKSFRVRERRFIIFGQNMLGESSFGKVESRVDDLRHLLFPLFEKMSSGKS